MVYDFGDKRDMCYDLYITQNKTIDEIAEYYKQFNFTPSKRAFQCHFKQWGFPAKRVRHGKDPALQARVKELWEVNTPNKQMLAILKDEGFEVSDRHVSEMRKKEGLLLRERNGGPGTRNEAPKQASVEQAHPNGEQAHTTTPPVAGRKRPNSALAEPPLPREIIIKRQARQAKLLAESVERLQNGTRRRRTKPWLGVPPDTGLPPRFPSELTLEESKSLLDLDNALYREVRETFTDICRANNVVKKTTCGQETWKFVKEELIGRIPHLQPIFHGPGSAELNPIREPMALDLICMDVTKKIRTIGNYIPLQDAKNILGLTPQESREIRNCLDAILRADYFTSKKDVSKEHWETLKEKWVNESPRLREELAGGGDSDPDFNEKLKSLECLARDVQKRYRDKQTNRDPNRKRRAAANGTKTKGKPKATMVSQATHAQNDSGPLEDLPARSQSRINPQTQPNDSNHPYQHSSTTTHPPSNTTTTALPPPAQPPYNPTSYTNMQIDPTLLPPTSQPQPSPNQQQQPPPPSNAPPPKAIYIRLTPLSAFTHPTAPKLWLETLYPPFTISQLHTLVTRKLSLLADEERVGKIEGLSGEEGEGGKWCIEEDDEVEAYLEYVASSASSSSSQRQQGKGKAVFVVEIE